MGKEFLRRSLPRALTRGSGQGFVKTKLGLFTILMRFVLLHLGTQPFTIVLHRNTPMEQHPVPQNVTTFQFRLIGDMTIKQFGYLAGGAMVGYICYKLPLPFFFTWPLAITFVVLGIGLAFVPIEERPMDVWLLSFIKSIYSPTQYLWQKTAQPKQAATPPAISTPMASPTPSIPQVLTAKPKASLTETLEQLFALHPKTVTPSPIRPLVALPGTRPSVLWSQHVWNPLGFFRQLFMTKPKTEQLVTPTTYPDVFAHIGALPSLTGNKVDLAQAPATTPLVQQQTAGQAQAQATAKEQELTEKLKKLQGELATKTTTDTRILELQKQLTDVLSERNKMEQELASLRQKLTQSAQAPQVIRQAGVVKAEVGQPTVRIITPDVAVKAGLPRLTTFPNVITGIIKDHDGNLLPGVLITVRDKDDIPVRALKTNKLGQFAASTPLPSGTYMVDIEDPRQLHFFDRIRVTLTGSVMSPVEVTSKSKKQMERSQLEKAIFGGSQI